MKGGERALGTSGQYIPFYYVYLTVEEEKQPIESCCLDFERRQRAQTDKITFVRTFCFEL